MTVEKVELPSDPYNVIITGVGGQGTVVASRVVGNMMSEKGLHVTVGETFGASQRGGSVMSHLRISSQPNWSPQIPRGRAHLVVAFEPIEALRVLKDYGNPATKALCNTRPIHPESVMAGDAEYPAIEDLERWVAELTESARFIPATDEALKLGSPILSNTIMVGALAGMCVLPMERGDFELVVSRTMTPQKVQANLAAYDRGVEFTRPTYVNDIGPE